MKSIEFSVAAPKRREALNGILKLNLVIGGATSTLLDLLMNDKDAINVVIDNATAIQLLRERHGDNGVFYFVMGECETTNSIHAHSDDATKQASSRTSNTNVSLGYGARLENSFVAADTLIESEGFQDFIANLPDLALSLMRGRPHMYEVTCYGSSAGAAYAGTAPKFADAIAKSLSYFDRPIQISFDIVGPITFARIAPRARPNSASSLLSHLGYALDFSKPHERRLAKRIMLREFIPFGDDQESRNHFVRLDHCMMNCVQMQDRLMQPSPNEEQDDQFGAIMSREVDYKTPLDRRKDIAAVTALGFLTRIEEAKRALLPDLSTVTEIIFDPLETEDFQRQSPEVIADLIFNHPPEKLLDSIARPGKKVRCQMRYASLVTDCIPEHISFTMAEYPTTIKEFIRRLEVLLGYQQVGKTELSAIEDEIEDLKSKLTPLESRFTNVVKKAAKRPSRILPRGAISFIANLRSEYDAIQDLESQKEACERALVVLRAEVDFLESKLASMASELKKWAPKGTVNVTNQYVTYGHIDRYFDRLMRLELLSDIEKLNLFCEAPSQVTLSGLAKIVGAGSERYEAIADRIVNGPYDFLGPSHGAQNLRYSSSIVYSIPPCDPETEAQLTKHIKLLHDSAGVVFGDTLSGGACVLRVRFRRFHSLQSLFDGLTGHDLWRAYTDTLSALNTIDGWKTLTALGGRVEGERITFDGPIREPRTAVINADSN